MKLAKVIFPQTNNPVLLLTLAGLLAMPAAAQVNYAVSGSTAYVTSSPNASGNVVIASTYNGYPVTSIADSAFSDCTSLTDVAIPDSITSIGNFVFRGCTSATNFSVGAGNSVYSSLNGVLFNKAQTILIQFPGGRGGSYAVPNSVYSIGNFAFESCYSLTSVTIPNIVYHIGRSAFSSCTSLTNAAIPDSVTDIGEGAFADSGLASVVIPNGVTSIERYTFINCTNLTSVTIPNSIITIYSYAFNRCINLTSVSIPGSVVGIGSEAFSFCSGLTNVTIGNNAFSMGSLGEYAFRNCSSLVSVTIGNSVYYIGDAAFSSCYSLTSVTIANSVTGIGDYAFSSCTSLTNLTFFGNAPSVGIGIFDNIAASAKVYYYYGRTGWGTAYGGLPTVMLGAPAPQVGTGTVGVKPGGFGFTLNGVVNQTIVVEVSTNLVNWQSIWTRTLSMLSTNFVDPDWVNHPHRFYRLRSN